MGECLRFAELEILLERLLKKEGMCGAIREKMTDLCTGGKIDDYTAALSIADVLM